MMTSLAGLDFERSGAVAWAYGNQIVPFIGRAALIKYKGASRRPPDLADPELLQDTNS